MIGEREQGERREGEVEGKSQKCVIYIAPSLPPSLPPFSPTLPSISTLNVSFKMLMVEIRTRMENRNVHTGSASFHSGCRDKQRNHHTNSSHS